MKRISKVYLILKYYEYINTILESDYDTDKYFFNNLGKINEGLISSCETTKAKKVLLNRFPELNITIEGSILLLQNFNSSLFKYDVLINTLGYFISEITYDGINWLNKFELNNKPLAINIEPKYDIKITEIPKILYHVSSDKHTKKIKEIGLISKSKNKLTNHPDRVYLTPDLEMAKLFCSQIEYEGEIPIIWKIDTTIKRDTLKVPIFILYKDPNFEEADAMYLLGNIPKENLTKL